MNENFWWGVVCAGMLMTVVGITVGWTTEVVRDDVARDCERNGAVWVRSVKYECKKSTAPKN